MTNARKIKEAIKQDLDSMTTEQLFAFCNLFEDARQYGISLNDTTFYTCDRCRREHNGCLREKNTSESVRFLYLPVSLASIMCFLHSFCCFCPRKNRDFSSYIISMIEFVPVCGFLYKFYIHILDNSWIHLG